MRIHRIVAEILVERAVKVIGSALRDDVDDTANRSSGLNAVGVVDDAKLAYRVSRRRGLLHTRCRGDVVRAVDGNELVVNVLSGKEKLGHWLTGSLQSACNVLSM